jgi:hypothetical protein
MALRRMWDARLVGKTLSGAIVGLALATGIARAFAEAPTSPTASPEPGPVVFQFEINRTTEPLSLFSVLPPPVPLNDILKMKGEQVTSASAAAIKKVEKSTAPPKPTPALSGRTTTTKIASRPSTSALAGPTPLPPAPLPPAPLATPRPLPPAPSFREFPDTVVLVNRESLSCKILSDMGAALRLELSTGVTVHIPKQRISQVNGKPP